MSALIRCQKPSYSLSSIFDDFFNENFFYNSGRELTGTKWPNVDIEEHENEYKIHADLPGLDRKDIKITVEDGVLSISGDKKHEKKEKKEKGRYYYYERSYGNFKRSFSLPDHVDEKSINANFSNGVLDLTIKKTEKAKPKKIEINVN